MDIRSKSNLQPKQRRKTMFTFKKSILVILGLIAVTSVALAYMESHTGGIPGTSPSPVNGNDGPVSVEVQSTQSKILMGSDGRVSVAVGMTARKLPDMPDQPIQPVDLVVVLDRSGSMDGAKIDDARKAIVGLIDRLSVEDRFALVTYSNDVQTVSRLVGLENDQRSRLVRAVEHIQAQGGTNLGGGLRRGIDTLLETPASGRQRKVILISDGLANQGITDPESLGQMAAAAVEHNFAVSTVGVGYDFNEVLMTTIADHGAGRYYFLEDPQAFARVFDDEFQTARKVVASGLELRIPVSGDIRLIRAGGYPVTHLNGMAVIHPGDLMSGQTRKLFLTFQVPSDQQREFTFGSMQVSYQCNGIEKRLKRPFDVTLACVPDPVEVAASVDKHTWTEKILQEDYSRLQEDVADAIRKGEKEAAQRRIQEYETRTRDLNASVGSAAVSQNLDDEVQVLRQSVEETFSGAPAAVEAKRKQNAKTLQYESYKVGRGKK
jgi:Ca-activated chloride channel family protein